MTAAHRYTGSPVVAPSPLVHLTGRRAVALAAAVTLLAFGAAAPAFAAPGDTSVDTTIANVEVSSAIALNALTPSFTLVGLPGATVTGNGAVEFNVETNNAGGYAVTVQAEDDVLNPADTDNPDVIPIGNLRVRETGDGAFTSLNDAAAVTVHRQAVRSASGGDALSNDYQVSIPFVASDTYSVTLDYVATAL